MLSKKAAIIVSALMFCGAAVAKNRTLVLDWNFRAPSVSNPDAVDPKTAGDILFDTASDSFKGWNGSIWQEFGGASATPNVDTVSASATLTTSYDVVLGNASSASITLDLPTAVGNEGKIFSIKKTDSSTNTVTVEANGSETIDGLANTVLRGENESIQIVSDNANWKILSQILNHYLVSKDSSSVSWPFASTAYGDLTSLTLPPGDWDIGGFFYTVNNGAVTASTITAGITTTSGNSGSGLEQSDNAMVVSNPGTNGFNVAVPIPQFRQVVTTPTTYYLKAKYQNTPTNLYYLGYKLWARRAK